MPRVPIAIALAFALAGPAAAAQLGENLQTLLEAARTQNPELALMRAEAEAARQRVQPAGALPDPVLRVERMNLRDAEAPPETRLTFMQQLPAWGKRELRVQAASADARQAQARTDAAWAELAMRIKTAYARYYAAVANERITREVLDLVRRMEQVAQARYAGGLAPQQDAIRAQLEQTAMRAELLMLEAEKHHLHVRINALLGRPSEAALAHPREPRPLPAVPDAATLVQRARATSPVVRAEEARLAAAEKNRELALRNRLPDVNVGAGPTRMNSRNASWGVMVELNLPLQQDTRRSQEAEAQAMVDAARARIDNAAVQVAGDIGESLASLDVARRTVDLVTAQALPQSELALRSALASYEGGKLEFSALLEAQRQIRKARLDRLKAETEAQMRLAEIERTLGEDL
ncbi:TolC family protein [Ramlibacter albus]|uniref:TolC family protein n=1 Tax=Ramlibacter albus TaxID=2079448 RepID=A0A923MAU9_9BURK|nr:TolC family protein [Ramlibacter albus]MBC5765954.1 TolC family protein [Ramlibacter albus]